MVGANAMVVINNMRGQNFDMALFIGAIVFFIILTSIGIWWARRSRR
jgi:hypothetical protein